MKRLFFLLILSFFIVSSATAATLKKDKLACLSKEFLNEAITALVEKDRLRWDYLHNNNYCIISAQDFPVSILDRTFWGKTKIRAYVDGDSVILWTDNNNIK